MAADIKFSGIRATPRDHVNHGNGLFFGFVNMMVLQWKCNNPDICVQIQTAADVFATNGNNS